MEAPVRSLEQFFTTPAKGDVPLGILNYNVETESFTFHLFNPHNREEIAAIVEKLGIALQFDQ